jgi:hypothetical protein
LREDPNDRPQDPVMLEKEMRDCLTKIERRQAIGRKLGISLASVVPRKVKETQPRSAITQVLGGFAAVVVLLLAAAAGAEYFFPDKIPYFHRSDKVGVQIGVPDATTPTQPAKDAVALNEPKQNPSPAIAETNQNPTANLEQNQTNTPATTPAVASNNQTASDTQQVEPVSPALGPTEPPLPSTTTPETSDQSSVADATQSNAQENTKDTAATSSGRSTSHRARDSYEDEGGRPPVNQARHHAEVVGRTRDGRLIVRLSSGRVVVLPRLKDGRNYPAQPRRRAYIERSDEFVPPVQPFNPND